MKSKNKFIIGIKTIALVSLLILGVLLPNLVLNKYPQESYAASSFSNTIETSLGTITLKTSATSFKEGDIVPIEIHVGGENINGLNGTLEYDKEKFKEIDITTDIDTLTGWGVDETKDKEGNGDIMFFINNDKYACSDATIATIYLSVIEDIETTTNFSINYIYICNTDYEDNVDELGMLPSITLTMEGNKIIEGEDPENPEQPDKPEVKYTISYNANTTEEVKGMPESQTKVEGKDYNIYGIEPSRIGYTFEGWNTLADGTGTTYLPGSIYNTDENLTLYAQWKEVPQLEVLELSSETYKIGNIDITKYEEGDKYISRVRKETMLKDYINNLITNADIVKVIKQDGQELLDEEYVGTGMKLVVTKGEETIELQIAVMGDLSGDGKVTTQDFSDINKVLLKTYTLQNEFRIAGDIDENGEISVTDFSDINKMLLKIL